MPCCVLLKSGVLLSQQLLTRTVYLQVSRVAASVPPLTEAEYYTTLASLNRALAVALSASRVIESHALPSAPRRLEEYFVYAEVAMRRVVRALREMPDFRALTLDHQMVILKVCLRVLFYKFEFMYLYQYEYVLVQYSQMLNGFTLRILFDPRYYYSSTV